VVYYLFVETCNTDDSEVKLKLKRSQCFFNVSLINMVGRMVVQK